MVLSLAMYLTGDNVIDISSYSWFGMNTKTQKSPKGFQRILVKAELFKHLKIRVVDGWYYCLQCHFVISFPVICPQKVL